VERHGDPAGGCLSRAGGTWRHDSCRDFSRLLEQLLDSPGAPPLLLKYLGACLAPTGLGEGGGATDASVLAVLLSVKFDEEGFECSASQVHAAARGNPDLIHVLLDAGVDITSPTVICGKRQRAGEHSIETA
jgi:hypothetical protein